MDDKTSKSEPAKGITTETHEPYPSSVTSIKRVGQYHIKRVLASGGMGTVYEATQEKPRRVVAIKLMKQGIASKSALRRFEYESQILARLRHPGIAQIYEAGTHRDDSGTVPYFAMEYIPHALSLTKYAKDKKLSTREKLDLFTQVCDAVHHGHQKGIIHRDLKPGNILVDSNGQVKVIDFGVARGTDSDMAVTTLQTDIGQLVGTLQYMSPEQCVADPHDIDTRSDVYALGVVLYELLAEKLPYKISSQQIFEGTRIIREQQPTNITTIDKTLKGDIETIIYKALEKDRERRYHRPTNLHKILDVTLVVKRFTPDHRAWSISFAFSPDVTKPCSVPSQRCLSCFWVGCL
jgi:non-specific serine/threonine protein kinase/serine/threonine-protein kinase